MRAPHFVIDAFVSGPFSGNPAAVCLLTEWPEDTVLAAIAAENNLSETAFCRARKDGEYDLRWFTPTVEIDLCGHATLATAHVLMSELRGRGDEGAPPADIAFNTRSGKLAVVREGDEYAMSLPAASVATSPPAPELLESLGLNDAELFRSAALAVLLLADEAAVRAVDPDFKELAKSGEELVCVTAPGHEADFVVRVFAPNVGIDEDPATGSAQCLLAPFWSQRLGRNELSSRQLSARGARIRARWHGGEDFVTVIGRCRTFVRGELELKGESGH